MNYNSQLPFPVFYEDKPTQQQNPAVVNHISFQDENNYNQSQQYQDFGYSQTTNKPVDDNFNSDEDFPSQNQIQHEFIQPGQTSINDANQLGNKEEDRLKRFDLLSSVFDEAMIEENNIQLQIEDSNKNQSQFSSNMFYSQPLINEPVKQTQNNPAHSYNFQNQQKFGRVFN